MPTPSGSSEDTGESHIGKATGDMHALLVYKFGFCFSPGIVVWHILQVSHLLHRHHSSNQISEAYHLLK